MLVTRFFVVLKITLTCRPKAWSRRLGRPSGHVKLRPPCDDIVLKNVVGSVGIALLCFFMSTIWRVARDPSFLDPPSGFAHPVLG